MTVTNITVSQLITGKASDAFDAFVEPSKITRFWLSSTTAPLSEGAKVVWQFMVPGAVNTVIIPPFHNISSREDYSGCSVRKYLAKIEIMAHAVTEERRLAPTACISVSSFIIIDRQCC